MELQLEVKAEDLPYEDDVLHNAHSAKSWLRYLAFKREASLNVRALLYERALQAVPGSYKLWHRYLLERKAALEPLRVDDPAYEALNVLFERALSVMHKMPVLWLLYLQHLSSQRLFTRSRHACDSALRALPITQHDRVWPVYLSAVKSSGVSESVMRVYRRFLQLERGSVEDYISYLISVGQIEEAATQLVKVIDDQDFTSKHGKSKHDLWLQLTELASKHPRQVSSLRVEPLIRTGLAKFSNEVGRLWTALADYYVRLAHFERARDVFEEGLASVRTVRDFAQLWDAYSELEYGLLQAAMEHADSDSEAALELERSVARYERLIARQPLLISDVVLRQNPHNVTEWIKRTELLVQSGDAPRAVAEFTRALRTVEPLKATGKLHLLWIAFAQFWEQRHRIDEARAVLEKAVLVPFKKLDHLASVWCEYVELELRQKDYERARTLLQRATATPAQPQLVPYTAPTPERIFKSVRLWSLFADLEESFGTAASVRACYEGAFTLRIATPAVALHYAQYLEDQRCFEEAFRVYERAVALFKFPALLDVWVTYLRKFMQRYGGTKLERLRDLFEQALAAAPAQFSPSLYLMYAEAEEQYGLARHALLVLDRGTRHVDSAMRPALYNIYLQRATENFGVTRARQIFEQAIAQLEPTQVRQFALRYARLERRLGEIDRSRAILAHCAQFCPPARDAAFWEEWREFEVKHGSVDTVREMFRVKRSVAARFATSYANFTPATAGVLPGTTGGQEQPSSAADKMQALEQLQREEEEEEQERERQKQQGQGQEAQGGQEEAKKDNDDEIDLSDDDEAQEAKEGEDEEEGEEEEDDGFVIAQKSVPSAVFGSAADKVEASLMKGAKERLKKNQNR